jgi:hypothetical protein
MRCPDCRRPMHGNSCLRPSRAYGGGSEPDWGMLGLQPPRHRYCRDCGTPPAGAHHRDCLQATCALPHVDEVDQAALCEHAPPDPEDGDGGGAG